jgi:hypothetical protein
MLVAQLPERLCVGGSPERWKSIRVTVNLVWVVDQNRYRNCSECEEGSLNDLA